MATNGWQTRYKGWSHSDVLAEAVAHRDVVEEQFDPDGIIPFDIYDTMRPLRQEFTRLKHQTQRLASKWEDWPRLDRKHTTGYKLMLSRIIENIYTAINRLPYAANPA